jgi:DNA-binding XRE family transcriptional regulator
MTTKTEYKPLTLDLAKFALDSYTYRTERNYTRENLADIVDCSQHMINSYEAKGILPRVDVFYNVCLLMGKDVSEYFK